MGTYIYRLKGTKSFTEEMIDGQKEKVYDLVFWYKYSSSSFWNDKISPTQKARNMLAARLENSFAAIGYPKFVRHVIEENGKLNRGFGDTIMEWNRKQIDISDDSKKWEELRKFKLNN